MATGKKFKAWSRYFDYASSLENNAFSNPGFNALSRWEICSR